MIFSKLSRYFLDGIPATGVSESVEEGCRKRVMNKTKIDLIMVLVVRE